MEFIARSYTTARASLVTFETVKARLDAARPPLDAAAVHLRLRQRKLWVVVVWGEGATELVFPREPRGHAIDVPARWKRWLRRAREEPMPEE